MRTSIALMGFGFVIVKFALFLRQLALMFGNTAVKPAPGNSAMVGVGMVALGAIITILAYIRYYNIEKQLNNRQFSSSRWLSVLVALCILVVAVLMVLYLLPGIYNR